MTISFSTRWDLAEAPRLRSTRKWEEIDAPFSAELADVKTGDFLPILFIRSDKLVPKCGLLIRLKRRVT